MKRIRQTPRYDVRRIDGQWWVVQAHGLTIGHHRMNRKIAGPYAEKVTALDRCDELTRAAKGG